MKAHWLLCLVLGLALLAGCQPQRDGAYRNEHLGFHFLPPPGWSERSRNEDATPTTAPSERMLVQYKRLTAGHPAWLCLTVVETPANVTPAMCLARRGLVKNWRRAGGLENLDVNGVPAARLTTAGRVGKLEYHSELVAVRQGERIYYWSGTFPAGDTMAREQVRQALASAVWRDTGALARR